MELVGTQTECYVTEKNTTFKISDTEKLTHEAIHRIQFRLGNIVLGTQKICRKKISMKNS